MIPLSCAQQGLWLIDQIDGPSSAYNIPMAARLRGELDRHALRDAIGDVICRHEALRTVFPVSGGQPRQMIIDADQVRVSLGELGCAPGQLREEISAIARQAFDLSRELPIRAVILNTCPGECVLVLVLHHIAADGGSIGPLCADLSAAYTARISGGRPDWPELPVQYVDYTRWQQECLGSGAEPDSVLSRQLAFWTDVLRGVPEELNLPADRPRAHQPGSRNGTAHFRVGRRAHRLLAAVGEACNATMFMVIQAALAALLTRLGAGTDIPLGTPVAGRDDEALNGLVGLFVNTLVLRTDTSGNPSFRDLVCRVRDFDIAAYAHRELPFERLVQEINPLRAPSRHPLFQVMLVVQSPAPRPALELPGIIAEVEPVATGTAKLDLQVGLVEHPGRAGLDGSVEFDSGLFDQDTAELIADRLVRLLDAAAADADQAIGSIGILSAAEKQRILAAQRASARQSCPASLEDLVRGQADQTPAAVALSAGGRQLSYQALADRAERVAAWLTAHSAGPGRTVALMLPRCPDLVVAMLACQIAGAAHVPIDPDLPADRIAALLSDCAPVAVVSAGDLPVPCGLPRLTLCRDPRLPAADRAPVHPASPGDPAYVIYTSGSTGSPKGVVISRGALAAYLAWCRESYEGLDDSSVVHTSVSYDMTITALFGPLACGGRVELAQSLDGIISPGLLKVTPSHLELVSSETAAASPGRVLLIGGEALLGGQLAGWRDSHPDVTVINEYGPTEATVGCVVHRIGPREPMPAGPVPIGRPIRDTGAYVLDDLLQPVPDQVPGELYLSGAQLAVGYLRRPAQTAERFIADPYGQPGTRMYRTGDLVRRRRDGLLEYLGRSDQQVKLRGFRIETGEIESALVSCPEVDQAAVVLRDDGPGGQQLVGYLAGAAETMDLTAIRARLARVLPAHMLPATLMTLPRLPVTPNGKLDSAALPAPRFSGTSRPPRTSSEEALCRLFAEILGLPDIGIDDSFFEAGGHSLLVLRLSIRIRERLGRDVSVRDIFSCPTAARLAARLESQTGTAGPAPGNAEVPGAAWAGSSLDPLLTLAAGGAAAPVFLLPPATGVCWMYADLAGYIGPRHPVHGLQTAGLPGRPADFASIVDCHLTQLLDLAPDGRCHLLGWSFGATVAHALAVRLQSLDLSVSSLTLLDGYPAGWAPDPLRGERRPAQHDAVPRRADGEQAVRDWSALRMLLSSIGYPPTGSPEVALVAARNRGGPLAGLADEVIDTLASAFRANAAALAGGRSGRLDGDAFIFTSADGAAAPGAWKPHIAGLLEVHSLSVRHGQMTSPEAVSRIGPILTRRLG